jgi:type IV secretory pathway VirB2 component (pilin)
MTVPDVVSLSTALVSALDSPSVGLVWQLLTTLVAALFTFLFLVVFAPEVLPTRWQVRAAALRLRQWLLVVLSLRAWLSVLIPRYGSWAFGAILFMFLFLGSGAAFAGGGGGALPWEGPLTLVANSLTGPVALSISLVALAATGGILVFGGELNAFARQLCVLVLAISFLVAGAGIMTTLFGVGGAVI